MTHFKLQGIKPFFNVIESLVYLLLKSIQLDHTIDFGCQCEQYQMLGELL